MWKKKEKEFFFGLFIMATLQFNHILSFECGLKKSKINEAIVRGQQTSPGDWPWHTAIYHRNGVFYSYVCGGTLISKQFVLTAVHCVKSDNSYLLSPMKVFVRLGVTNLNKLDSKTFQQHDVLSLYAYDNLNKRRNDIALLKLETQAEFNNFVQPACVNQVEDLTRNLGTAVGWGIDEKDQLSPIMKSASMPVVSTNQCLEITDGVFRLALDSSLFCAGYANGTTVCNGDSGGGLHFERNGVWYVGGIVSFTAPRDPSSNLCHTESYAAFTNVQHFSSWIRKVTQLQYLNETIESGKETDEEVPDEGPFRNTRNVEFDWKIAQNIIFTQTDNTVISPLLIKVMLTLLYEASDDATTNYDTSTKRELRLVLEPNGNLNDTRYKYRFYLNSAVKPNALYDLQINTKFFVDEFIDVNSKYQIISYEYYNATVGKVPFSKPQIAANQINDWVSETTNGHFNEIINAMSVEGADITLANVVYFEGLWKYPFPKKNFRRAFNAIDRKVQVDYMIQNAPLYYDDSATLGAQLLRMPYQGGQFAMYFVLPHQGKSVDDVLSRITPQSLHQALWYMDESDVNVIIPKFQFYFSKEMNKPLQDIGIRDIFSTDTSFPMLRSKDLRDQVQVLKVFQKVGVIVNEVGGETTTENRHVYSSSGNDTQIFVANRPFVFFIEDERTGSMLVVGKVEDPTTTMPRFVPARG